MKSVFPLLLISLLMAALLAPLASTWPDGLEKVATELHLSHLAPEHPLVNSLLPDYNIPGLEGTFLSTSIAGVIGTLICFLLPFSLYLLRRK